MSTLALQTQQGTIRLDLAVVERAESRIAEIAFVTSIKAPELLASFNMAHSDLVSMIGKVELAMRRAERKANEIRAVIVLDKCKDILKAKGLSKDSNPAGSEDLRRAVLDADPEYATALDAVDQLEALCEYLRGKQKTLEMAYHSVKRIIQEPSYLGRGNLHGSDADLEGVTDPNQPVRK